MWGGPFNPKGGYSLPTHYFDGTAIHDEDFSDRHYPNNLTTTSYGSTRDRYSEEDIFMMVPPSMACSSFVLPANDVVFDNLGNGDSGDNYRSVVCKGIILIAFLPEPLQL